MEFVEQLPKFQEVSNTLAQMIIATRMGLNFFDEGALKNSISGLEKVIMGLEKLQISIAG